MKTCKCGVVFDDDESVGSDFGMCQMCWEDYCSDEWHKLMEAQA